MEMAGYEDLHRQARLLEGELDLKLTQYNNLCSVPVKQVSFAEVRGSPSLLSEITVQAATSEIQGLIEKLNCLNDRMSDSMNDSDQIFTKHTVQRHGEILKDYRKEFAKIRENFNVAKERQALVGTTKTSGVRCQGASALAAEEYHLLRSEILIDGQLDLAHETKLQLLSQRKSMKKLQTLLRSLHHRFPALNDLIRRIELSKQKRFAALVIIILLILAVMHVMGSNERLLF